MRIVMTDATLIATAPIHNAATGRHHNRWQTRALVVTATLLGIAVVAAAGFWLTGGRWMVVRTPSMGSAAPVGTLILTRPTAITGLHVGDVIAFHPPGESAATYTHRVVALSAKGASTRGDINGASDPWTVADRDLVGRAVLIAPGWGWLFRALPLLAVGGLILFGITRLWIRPGNRAAVLLAGLSIIYLVAAVVLRPFTSVIQLTVSTDTDGAAAISAVSTGLLPIRLAPLPGRGSAAPIDLPHAGATGVVHLSNPPASGSYQLAAHLHLSLLGWMILGMFWASPILIALAVNARRRVADPTAAT